jgi:tetratricopeptide (TPR) repeat protein
MVGIGHLISLFFASASISIISLIASSQLLEDTAPRLALRLNPFNVDAFIALSEDMLGGAANPADLDQLMATAERMVAWAPGDARLYSVQGVAAGQKGEVAEALSAFRHALVLAPTELQALRWMIEHSAEQNDDAKVVDLVDVLFRRWPDRIAVYADRLPAIFSDADQRRLLVQRLELGPPWRTALISSLSKSPDGALFAADLLWDLAQGEGGRNGGEINQVIGALLAAGRYDDAYQTFLVTLNGPRQKLTGNVYNGSFFDTQSGAPFDWMIKRQPGLALSMAKADDGAPASGLSIEFQQAPVRDPGVRQYVYLSPGRYRLSVKASAQGAVLPKGLFWSVTCFKPGTVLGTLPVQQGTYPILAISTELVVPAEHCGLQVLRLGTRSMAGSWNDRYSGRVQFEDVRIVSVP